MNEEQIQQQEEKKNKNRDNEITGFLFLVLFIVFWITFNFLTGLFLAIIGTIIWLQIAKKVADKQTANKIVIGIIVLLILVPIISSLNSATKSDKEMRERSDEIVAGLAEDAIYITESGTPERKIELKVIEILGHETNMKEPKVRGINFEENELWIDYIADENLTTNLTRHGILSDTKFLLQELPSIIQPNIEGLVFQSYLTLVDTYGKESISKVLMVTVTKETWEKINWENFLTDNLPNIADTYWEHPVLKK